MVGDTFWRRCPPNYFSAATALMYAYSIFEYVSYSSLKNLSFTMEMPNYGAVAVLLIQVHHKVHHIKSYFCWAAIFQDAH